MYGFVRLPGCEFLARNNSEAHTAPTCLEEYMYIHVIDF